MLRLLLLPANLLLALAVYAGPVADTTAPKADTLPIKKPVADSSFKKPVLKADTTLKRQALKPALNDTSRHPLDSTSARKVPKPGPPPKLPDSIYLSQGGLRLGLDISRIPVHFFQPYRTDVTVQADLRINAKMYAALEGGYNRTSHSDTMYTYKGNGFYTTLGIDYDLLKKQSVDELNMVFLGVRYGYAHTTYEVPTYNIKSPYWGADIPGNVPSTSSSAHWIELVFGMRVEVLKNFFLGWGLREKIMIYNSADKAAPPFIIAGFGSGNKRSQFDMTYSLSYQIPLYKIKVHVPRQPKKK